MGPARKSVLKPSRRSASAWARAFRAVGWSWAANTIPSRLVVSMPWSIGTPYLIPTLGMIMASWALGLDGLFAWGAKIPAWYIRHSRGFCPIWRSLTPEAPSKLRYRSQVKGWEVITSRIAHTNASSVIELSDTPWRDLDPPFFGGCNQDLYLWHELTHLR